MFKLSSFSLIKSAHAAADASAGGAGSAASNWNDGICAEGGVATIRGFECLFKNLLQVIGWVAGITFFIMFIVGGFKYLTAGGDPKKAAAASSALTISIAGMIGVIVSWLIILLIKTLTGVDVTNFNIGTT